MKEGSASHISSSSSLAFKQSKNLRKNYGFSIGKPGFKHQPCLLKLSELEQLSLSESLFAHLLNGASSAFHKDLV